MDNNMRFGLICIAFTAVIASLINLHQTFQITNLTKRTIALEAACKAHGIVLTTPEAP